MHLTTDELVQGAVQARERGWPGVKLKIGKLAEAALGGLVNVGPTAAWALLQ